jgi:hypothetical protein
VIGLRLRIGESGEDVGSALSERRDRPGLDGAEAAYRF